MPKRQRIDSVTAQVHVIGKAARELTVPAHVSLQERDLPFWNSVIAEFARSEWTDHQLELAAMLARTMSDLEEEQRLFREEGTIMHTDRGTPVINPRKTAIQMHFGNIFTARRSLSLHARAQGGEMETIGPRRAKAKAMENAASADDDLLAA